MNTIIEEKQATTIINKSKFICCLFKINDIDEVEINLNKVKEEYKDATHYCYAYIVDSKKRCSDDKEPSGTAGLPILNVLEKNEMNHILVVVVRYFGGVKLGAGGLVRAYTNSVTNCLEENIKEATSGIRLKIMFNYEKVKIIDSLIDNIIDKSFDEIICYEILISKDNYEEIKDKLDSLCFKIDVIDNNVVL